VSAAGVLLDESRKLERDVERARCRQGKTVLAIGIAGGRRLEPSGARHSAERHAWKDGSRLIGHGAVDNLRERGRGAVQHEHEDQNRCVYQPTTG
jgi:hypothetical protein